MTYAYKVVVRPQHERETVIKSALGMPFRTLVSYDVYEGKSAELPVVNLSLDVPIYRMANGRTATQQLAYLQERGLSESYFINGQENEPAQQAQHAILRAFARDGTEQITSIYEVLKRDSQRDPILITQRGVVVNGNRRLAAMRELYFEDSITFGSFANVECAVLPPLEERDIEEIEIRLQMTPETKLPYGWVEECLVIRHQIQSGKSEEQVANLMRKRPRDVRAALGALSEAEMYLRDWRKSPGNYMAVSDARQFFFDLPQQLKGKRPDLLEASRRVGWLLLDSRGDLGNRIYSYNAMIGEKAEQVLSTVSKNLGIDNVEPPLEVPEAEGDLEIDLGESEAPTSPYTKFITAIDVADRRSEITAELVHVYQTLVDAGKTAKQGQSALVAVRDAHNRLTEVDLTKSDPATFEAMERQLVEIVARAEDLISRLQTIKNSAESGLRKGV